MGWPICGETLAFLKPHKSNSTGSFLQQRCSRYGKVFKSHLFCSPAIVSCDHELNMFILQNEEKYFQVSYPKPMHGILGKLSLLTVSGDLHKKLRNVAVNFIGASKSTPAFLHSFTINLMVKHLLSIEPEEPIAFKILEDFQTFMKGFVSLPVYIPGTHYANAVKARARLSRTVREIVRERQHENMRAGEGDFLDVILKKRSLSEEETVSIVLDIMLGGYETTATLLALIVYFLAHAPAVFQKLKVILEAMRCGNVVKFVHREAIRDVKFKEYLIPSGWKVLPVFTAAHFDLNLHENPSEFNPSRWTDKASVISKRVMPFGGGPRLCPGAELAKVEISFFLHHLVLNYR
ncbi:cytochrome P450 724B1 [Citrus sinensis]|nr:cytochrome P450 724B1 [Citrus sinensis]